jgi:hypothetical protein
MAMRQSTRAWMAMLALTALGSASLAAGLAEPSRIAWVASLGALAFLKGRLILLDFLQLRRAGKWRSALVAGYGAATALAIAGLAVRGT